jgi:hypothetical protein
VCYLGSRAALGLPANAALYWTFMCSIIMHEIVLYGTLGPVFPYLGALSLLQFPLMSLLRLPWFRGKRLGNIVFWAFLIIGSTLAIVLYARDFARHNGLGHAAPLPAGGTPVSDMMGEHSRLWTPLVGAPCSHRG